MAQNISLKCEPTQVVYVQPVAPGTTPLEFILGILVAGMILLAVLKLTGGPDTNAREARPGDCGAPVNVIIDGEARQFFPVCK